MSPSDLPEYLRADYEALPERRREAYLTAMVEAIAIAEGRAARVPTDPARRRLLADAMAERSEADAIAAWLAEAPFPGPMPPSSPRARRPMRPISDRDVSRSGAVG